MIRTEAGKLDVGYGEGEEAEERVREKAVARDSDEPEVAVTLTSYVPGAALEVERLRVEVAEPPEDTDAELGSRVNMGPEGDTLAAKLTVPAKPFWLVTMMVALPNEPIIMLNEEWFEVTEKSGPTTITVTLVKCVFPPPDPVVETLYEPGVAELPTVTFKIVVPGLEGVTPTLVVLRAAIIPVGAVGVVNVTVAEKPFKLDTVSVNACDDPWFMVRLEELGDVRKSGCSTMNLPCIGPWCTKHQYV